MFVVTGLHTKRRPRSGTDGSSATTRKRGVKRVSQPPTMSHLHRRLHPATPSDSASSSDQFAPRVSGLWMTRNDDDVDPRNRNTKGRLPTTKVTPGPLVPPRIRKFIPKPLILVERMKARQLLDSSPSVALACSGSLALPRNGTTTPLSVHVIPTTHRIPTCSSLSSDSHSSGSISVRVSSWNSVVFGSGFGMMPRRARPLSILTLGDSSASTDTFVADSPCCVKQASSKVPLLVTSSETTNVRLEVEPDFRKKSIFHTDVPILGDSVAIDSMHRTLQSIDAFEPAVTSTPFALSRGDTSGVPSPPAFIRSMVYPQRLRGQMYNFTDSFEAVSPTSLAVHPFNAPKDTYTVKLPNSGSAAPKPALGFRRLSNRGAPPSPTLVLDGVFALPRSSPSSPFPPRRTLSGFPRPRKPSLRRPLSDIPNAPAVGPPSELPMASPMSSRGQFGLESPRSKLAQVLTAHARPQTTNRARRQTRLPPLVRGVEVSNDPRTQREIEGLRVRRVVELGRGGSNKVGGDSDEGKAIERMSLASVGMVARLRARWETGTAEDSRV